MAKDFKNINFKIPVNDWENLKKIAEKNDLNISILARKALKEFIKTAEKLDK